MSKYTIQLPPPYTTTEDLLRRSMVNISKSLYGNDENYMRKQLTQASIIAIKERKDFVALCRKSQEIFVKFLSITIFKNIKVNRDAFESEDINLFDTNLVFDCFLNREEDDIELRRLNIAEECRNYENDSEYSFDIIESGCMILQIELIDYDTFIPFTKRIDVTDEWNQYKNLQVYQ